ncbi:unnamed protein product [Ectocarpus sp. 12 AP-2014]
MLLSTTGVGNGLESGNSGYDDGTLAVWHPQARPHKHVDPETGYWFYENLATGERHWDRPLEGVAPLRPKSPRPDEKLVDDARHKRQRSERESRRKDMTIRRARFDRLLLEEGKSAEIKEAERVQSLWDEAEQHAARKEGDFSLAWKQVPSVSESHIFGFPARNGGTRIVNLRLVGLGLTEVPGAIGQNLLSLKSLSLSSNAIEKIPDGLCDLTALTELNLVRNKLSDLPNRFGNLLRLRNLSLAGNRLETIPPSFGNLLRLDQVVLDCNALRRLPETLGRMKCRWLNVSNNKLAGLPHCLKDMPRLTKISAVNNGLRSLPSDIGDSRSLTALHLASNRLNQLPDSICRLKTLKVLWLDHNFIAGLPMMFHQLGGLQQLMLEQNDMVYPPKEIILQGCDRVRGWCYRRMHDRVMARQHTIVMAVQDILKQIHERGLGHPAFFEPDVEVGMNEGTDHFYALVYERFWDTMLPALEREWQTGTAAPRGAVTSFGYSREEVDGVLLDYRDPTGRVLRTKTQMFRRCGCMGANGRRRVCVPPKVGWMCERKATLIKHDIILEREQEERRRQATEREDIEFRVALAKRLVKEGSETIEGKKNYTKKAIRMAEALKKKKQMGEFESEAEAMKAHRRQVVEKKFSKRKDALNKEREHRLADLKLKVAGLQAELVSLRGWGKEQKEAQIDQVLASMASLPEDKKLAEVEQQLEEEVAKLEEKAALVVTQKASKVMGKKVKRGDKEFQEIVDEMVVDLVLQDMEEAGENARRKAEQEHEVFRRIMAMWLGVGMRESFAEWKIWTKKRISQRRKDARKALREAWHDYEAAGVVSVMAEWKASFWEEEYDIYTDTQTWRHKETGEVRTVRPTVKEFIPDGYEVPKPPSQRLEDMSSTGSSSGGDSSGDTEETAPRRRGRGTAGDSRSDGSRSSGWSIASSSSRSSSSDSGGSSGGDDRGDDDYDNGGDGDGGGSSSDVEDGESSRSSSARSTSAGAASSLAAFDAADSEEDRQVSSTSSSGSGSRSGSSSSSADNASGSSAGDSDDESTGSDHDRESVSSSSSSPLLLLSDGDNIDATSSASRATTKRTSKDETTVTTTLATTAPDTDSAEAVALQITSGDVHEAASGHQDRALTLGLVCYVDTNVPSPVDGVAGKAIVSGNRKASMRVDKEPSRKTSRSKSRGLAVFIKDRAVEVLKDVEKLVQASDGGSSSPSSLRTEKSLQRQKEWEIDHALVRARKLREERVQDYQQEQKIRREIAAIEAAKLSSHGTVEPSVDEVMSMVGWDPQGTYTNKEFETFANKATKKLRELGREDTFELAKYGNKAF